MSDDVWKIRITETLTITREITNKSYPDMSAEEAKAYEEGMLIDDKIVNLAENLSYIEEKDMIYGEIVRIIKD